MRRTLAVIVALTGCERERRDPPPAPPPSPRPIPKSKWPECLEAFPLASHPLASERPLRPIDRQPDEEADHFFARLRVRKAQLSKLSLEELLRQAEPGEVGDVVVERISQLDLATPDRVTPAQRRVLSRMMLSAEVSNGGFDQYFFNPSGDHAIEARAGLVAIGPAELVPVLDCALAGFPDGAPSRDRDTRQRQLDRVRATHGEVFRPLDESFYAFPDRDVVLYEYAGTHARELWR